MPIKKYFSCSLVKIIAQRMKDNINRDIPHQYDEVLNNKSSIDIKNAFIRASKKLARKYKKAQP